MAFSVFSLPEKLVSAEVADKIESGVYKRAGFAFCFSDFGDVFDLVFEEFFGELYVDKGVFDSLVA